MCLWLAWCAVISTFSEMHFNRYPDIFRFLFLFFFFRRPEGDGGGEDDSGFCLLDRSEVKGEKEEISSSIAMKEENKR